MDVIVIPFWFVDVCYVWDADGNEFTNLIDFYVEFEIIFEGCITKNDRAIKRDNLIIDKHKIFIFFIVFMDPIGTFNF